MKKVQPCAIRGFLVGAVLMLAGCTAMNAQNPSSGYAPVNAVADAQSESVMLTGFDVVSYFVDGKHAVGSPEIKSDYKAVTFYFSKAEHKAMFDKAPDKYLPEFGGYCANGLVYGIPWGGDGDSWKLIDGKLYIFGGQGSKDAFLLDEKGNVALANKYWKEEVSGSNSFWQRSKRLVFRVPHYKSGEELAKAVSDAKAQGKL
jgi:YHS domain-containing protein